MAPDIPVELSLQGLMPLDQSGRIRLGLLDPDVTSGLEYRCRIAGSASARACASAKRVCSSIPSRRAAGGLAVASGAGRIPHPGLAMRSEISYAEFERVDVGAGEIVRAEPLPHAHKPTWKL
jgi:hypothetical protein